MLEKALVGGIVGGLTVIITALLLKRGNKKRDSGKYLEKKLKPYLNATKALLENYQSQPYYADLIGYIIDYLYEMKYSDKKYYINTYGLQTDADIHKTKFTQYYEDMKNAPAEAHTVWSLLIVCHYISKKNNANFKSLNDYINDKLNKINIDYPASFDVLKCGE